MCTPTIYENNQHLLMLKFRKHFIIYEVMINSVLDITRRLLTHENRSRIWAYSYAYDEYTNHEIQINNIAFIGQK